MGTISHTMHLAFPGTCWDEGKAWYPICQLEHFLALKMSTITIWKTRNFIDVNFRLQLLHINSVLQVFCLLQTIPYWLHIFTPFILCYVLIIMSGNLPSTPTLITRMCSKVSKFSCTHHLVLHLAHCSTRHSFTPPLTHFWDHSVHHFILFRIVPPLHLLHSLQASMAQSTISLSCWDYGTISYQTSLTVNFTFPLPHSSFLVTYNSNSASFMPYHQLQGNISMEVNVAAPIFLNNHSFTQGSFYSFTGMLYSSIATGFLPSGGNSHHAQVFPPLKAACHTTTCSHNTIMNPVPTYV